MTTVRRIVLLCLIAASASAQLKYSPDSLYLVEKDGTPVFLNGTAPWDINNVSLSDAKRCLDSIASHGMNYCQIRAMSPALFGGIANAYGVNPWQGNQTFASTPTEAFWAHMDSLIGYAKTKHIYFMLYIDYLGGDGSAQGWGVQTTNSTSSQMQAWGRYMGNRYKDSTNILWCASGDIAPTAWQTNLEAMITGLKSTGDTHLISTRDEPGTTTDTYWSTRPWVTLNGSYPFWSTWDVNVLQRAAKDMRARNPRKPAGLQEAWYEGEHGVAQTQLRSQSYWMTLGGSIAFQIFGNCPLWDFSKSTAFCGAGDWNQELDSQGMRNQRIFARIVLGRKWYKLIPDTNHVVTTAGYGTWGGTDYAVTSYTSDSSTVLCYMPSTRQVTVNTNYLKAGGSVAASWLNPATGDSTYIGTFARSASRTFTPPAGSDFVLALEATSTSAQVPPPAPVPAAPANGATGVATNPTMTWNASSGADSYRLQLSADSTFAATFLDQSGITATSFAASGLLNSKRYFWHVNATNTAGTSVYSTVFRFTTTALPPPPPAPVLATPANGTTGLATNPTLTWNASAGAASYRIQLSADSTFATTFADQSGLTSTTFTASGLSTGARYFWHVNAANTAGTSAYSGAFNFTTGAPPTGLVAAYAFDEGAGSTVADKSGNNLTGTIVGATWTAGGKYGKALSFNGTTGYVDLGNPAKLQITGSMTVSAWVNAATNPADDGQIIAKSNDVSGWQLKTTPDTGPQTFGVAVSRSAGSHTQRYSTTARSLNTWYYVAGVYDATARTLNMYVNGILDNGTLSGTVAASQVNSGVNVNIGRRSPGSYGGFYFSGIIDEVRVYNRPLSQAEIQADMITPVGSAPTLPPAPVLATPANGTTGVATNPTLTWNASTGAASYRLQLSADSTFATTFVDQSSIAATSFAASSLANNKRYFWHVNASNTAGTSGYSGAFNFTTASPPPPPPVPVLATPLNGATGVATNPTLTWNASAGAASYHLQLSADSTFATTFVSQSGIAATSFASSGLANGKRYFWHVNATNATGTSVYSGAFNFTTAATPPPPPPAPVLATPANGTTGVATNPTLTWNASTGATSYHLQLSADSTFATTLVNQSGITITTYAASGLAAGSRYFWHVNAANASGTSAYSGAFNFTTAATPPPPPPAPVLATPANGATGLSVAPTLTWNASTGATSYRLQLSADSTFTTTSADQGGITSTTFTASGLATGTRYFWHVNATNAGGTSAYSSRFSFATIASPTGLLAAYAFDEGAGTTVSDKSGNNLTGTIVGATWTAGGKYGKALSFNGTTGYVDLGNPAQLQLTGSMTVSAWINAAANPADDGQIIAKSDDATGWQLKTSPDTGPQTFGVAVTGSSGLHTQRYSTSARALNTWYYVAGVYDASARTLSTYVNGVLNNGTLSGTVPASQVNLGVNVNIGRRSPGSYGGFYFNGIIDEVRVYSRALSQSEIQNDMNTPLSAPAAQLGPVIVGVQAVARSTMVNVAWSEKAGTVSNVSSAPAMDEGAIAVQGSAPKLESTIDLNVSAVENGTSSYQWQQDGVDIPGATGRAYTVRVGNPSSPVTRIRCIAWNQSGADTSSEAVISHQAVTGADVISETQKPLTYSLEQNYPNPFNPATTIRYATPRAGYVKLEVYNLMGQKVATLVGGEQEAGYHDVRFDASNLASGLYFYRLQAGDFNQTRKLQLMK